jgi:hypothetical protein
MFGRVWQVKARAYALMFFSPGLPVNERRTRSVVAWGAQWGSAGGAL